MVLFRGFYWDNFVAVCFAQCALLRVTKWTDVLEILPLLKSVCHLSLGIPLKDIFPFF